MPDFRTGGNYREYSESSLERLKFIRSAQATGFSLQDVGELLRLTHSDGTPCAEVLGVARKRLADVRERLTELGRVERALAESLETCCRGKGPDLCDQITSLRVKKAKRLSIATRRSPHPASPRVEYRERGRKGGGKICGGGLDLAPRCKV